MRRLLIDTGWESGIDNKVINELDGGVGRVSRERETITKKEKEG